MRTVALAAAGLMAGCAGNSNLPKPNPVVTGHVTYRERVALPADAVVRVILLDVSRQDAAATPGADTTIRPEGRQVPLPLAIRYDPGRIDPRHDYAIRATITSDASASAGTPAWQSSPANRGLCRTSRTSSCGGHSGTSSRDARATLEFREPGRVSGRGSCNQFSGPVTVTGSEISFGPLVSTMMACAEVVRNQETRYLKALQDAERFALEGPYLLIYAKGVEKPLRFTHETPQR